MFFGRSSPFVPLLVFSWSLFLSLSRVKKFPTKEVRESLSLTRCLGSKELLSEIRNCVSDKKLCVSLYRDEPSSIPSVLFSLFPVHSYCCWFSRSSLTPRSFTGFSSCECYSFTRFEDRRQLTQLLHRHHHVFVLCLLRRPSSRLVDHPDHSSFSL